MKEEILKLIRGITKGTGRMIREYIIRLDDTLRGWQDDVDELEMKWDAEEVVSGEWIHYAQSDDCSLCGWSTGKYISPTPYCPNCGAKMKGYK